MTGHQLCEVRSHHTAYIYHVLIIFLDLSPSDTFSPVSVLYEGIILCHEKTCGPKASGNDDSESIYRKGRSIGLL